MTRDEILEYFKDINHAYNDCTRYDTLKRMIDELQEPCNDCISRQAVLNEIYNTDGISNIYFRLADKIIALPPVTPQYTDAEIQKMQDLEFAEIQKAYEIGKDEGSEVIDKIREEINKPVIRDEYSQRQNDYCDGYEFMCNRIKEIIDKYKASPIGAESEG